VDLLCVVTSFLVGKRASVCRFAAGEKTARDGMIDGLCRPRLATIGRRAVCDGGSRSKKGSTAMPLGTVKWFNPTKGYGFIAPETGGKDIFVHISAVQKAGLRSLSEGEKLDFEVEQQQNGRAAAVNLSKSA
jgi:CspA family cold shock protein